MIVAGIDLETTGLLDPEHRIIEVAILRFEYDPVSKVHTQVGSGLWRINPERTIEAKARAVHGISESDLIGKPNFRGVANEIAGALMGVDIGVAHNGLDFDFPFLLQEFERERLDPPNFTPFDTMLEGRFATPMGSVPNLGALCFACGVPYDRSQAHGALYDVQVMMECFFFGLRRGCFALPEPVF